MVRPAWPAHPDLVVDTIGLLVSAACLLGGLACGPGSLSMADQTATQARAETNFPLSVTAAHETALVVAVTRTASTLAPRRTPTLPR